IPFERMFDIYPGRTMNIIGNISMFIPVGIVWPLCFKKLDCLWKTVLAGAVFSLFIEISQLAFYERCSDVDDLLMNASGVLIGAILYFGVKKILSKE
ncbi:MAG: VanZ family protein, partial [Fibrobacter sp.]|nr:VanZ family protein [Fibrobacter sp.]